MWIFSVPLNNRVCASPVLRAWQRAAVQAAPLHHRHRAHALLHHPDTSGEPAPCAFRLKCAHALHSGITRYDMPLLSVLFCYRLCSQSYRGDEPVYTGCTWRNHGHVPAVVTVCRVTPRCSSPHTCHDCKRSRQAPVHRGANHPTPVTVHGPGRSLRTDDCPLKTLCH